MYSMIRDAVSSCAHCKLTNASSHKSQQILKTLDCDTPFDIVSLDVWSPGNLSNKFGDTKVLTCVDTMSGFAGADFLRTASSDEVAMRCFSAFFIPNGLPRLVIIDAGSENKGLVIAMCTNMGIAFHVVSPEDHNGILCERFHRYLNKIQRIQAADTQSFTQFAQGVMFACYAWNASPVDGTNIIRSFVAKSRHFPFPIQIKEDPNPVRTPPGQGESTLRHLETNFPLWAKQTTLLQILNEERRERHRELKNKSRNQKTFEVGDLVIVKKQVKSDASEGVSAKLIIAKHKGPYRVIDKLGDRSYMLQKLPTFQGKGKPGKPRKHSGALMEKIPSTVIVNKRIDSVDTRLAALEKPLVHNPLEQALGFYQFGRYVQAPPHSNFAFDRVEDLWSIELSGDSDTESEPETEAINEATNATTCDQTTRSVTTPTRPRMGNAGEQGHQTEPSKTSKRRASADLRSNRSSPRQRMADNYETFYEQIKQSKDKLFIIARRMGDRPKKDWFLVQVDWDESTGSNAISKGIYHVRWYIRSFQDSGRRTVSRCRHWPEVHEMLPNDVLGPMRVVRPSAQLETKLQKNKWFWYEQKINLFSEHIVGPFNFVKINNESHHVDPLIWQQLRRSVDQALVDISNLDRIEPLSSWKR